MTPEQLGRLMTDHAAALTLYARQWCDTADDVVQDSFMKLVRQSCTPPQVVPWLYRVVRNGALSALRSDKRRQHHEKQRASAPWFEPRDDNLDGQFAAQALQHLPMEQREPIVAHMWGGLTFEEIAQVCGSSASTVHRHYLAGLAQLRRVMGGGERCPTSIRKT